jgi:hypothetical protein
MVRFTIAQKFSDLYTKALCAAGINFLFEMTYDSDMDMWVAIIDVKECDHRRASEAFAQARSSLFGR